MQLLRNNSWPPAEQFAGKLWVNCLETVTSNVDGNQQLSRAKRLSNAESSEVRLLTSARNNRAHERPAPNVASWGEDMTRFSGKPEEKFKRLLTSFGRLILSRLPGRFK